MRKLVSVVMAAGLLVSLAACASTPLGGSTFSSCDSTGNAALVASKGKFGDDPKTDFPTPLVAKSAQLSITSKGDGKRVDSTNVVQVSVSVYDGSTGDAVQMQSGPITALPARLFVTDGIFPFAEALACAPVGSRVVTTGTAQQLFGEESLGLDPATSLVVVSDIQSTYLGKANGADQMPQAGYPAVVLAPNGRPGFTFPSGAIADGLGDVALKQGSGAKVAEGDAVIANVTGVVWGATSTFISSWDGNAPQTLSLGDDTALPSAVVKAIVGQKVGSQLLVVASGDDSYAAGQEPTGVVAGDTVVFVVDILGISK